ncbi:YdeI/OmpD-associated family protein [Candidatus Saccharibacteria bacterium]|nr:YdeI/OmpD-associated family protein [Candidatus Saccharibacteria bacterium]
METLDSLEISLFEDNAWHAWLEQNHTQNKGLWLKISKKGSVYPSISYADALNEALCYGWIDGQKQAYDDGYYLQKFTPRRSKSVWSKINVSHIERLVSAGRMQPSGLAAVEPAKADGCWDAAYDGARSIKMSPEFEAALAASPKAKAFYNSLDRSNTYAYLWRLQTTTNPTNRALKMKQFIGMLERGERLH